MQWDFGTVKFSVAVGWGLGKLLGMNRSLFCFWLTNRRNQLIVSNSFKVGCGQIKIASISVYIKHEWHTDWCLSELVTVYTRIITRVIIFSTCDLSSEALTYCRLQCQYFVLLSVVNKQQHVNSVAILIVIHRIHSNGKGSLVSNNYPG